jgi:hypothetical protein
MSQITNLLPNVTNNVDISSTPQNGQYAKGPVDEIRWDFKFTRGALTAFGRVTTFIKNSTTVFVNLEIGTGSDSVGLTGITATTADGKKITYAIAIDNSQPGVNSVLTYNQTLVSFEQPANNTSEPSFVAYEGAN